MFQKLYRAAFSTLEQLESRRLLSADLVADHQGIYPTDSVAVNGTTFFTADDGVHGTELWKSDGTQAGTKLVKDVTPGMQSSLLSGMTQFGDSLMFFSIGNNSVTLWRSDGSAQGTVAIATISGGVLSHTVAGGKFIFVMGNTASDDSGTWIWSSDGTADGTKQLQRVNNEGGGSAELHAVGGRAVFLLDWFLWSTDGTSNGTFQIPCPDHTNGLGTDWFASDGGVVLNDNLIFADNSRHEVWGTDGTVAGTKLIKSGDNLCGIEGFQSIGEKLLFLGRALNTDQYYLWSTDGTTQGTAVLTPVFVGNPPLEFANHQVFFTTGNGQWFLATTHGVTDAAVDLWATDGTASGTRLVKSLTGQLYASIGEAGGLLFLLCDDANNKLTLWKSDGTTDGTTAIRDLSNLGHSAPFYLTEADGKLAITTDSDPTQATIVDPSTFAVSDGPIQGHMKLTDGILRIFGTTDDDNIRIYRSTTDASRVVVDLDGTKKTFALADLSRIYVYAYSGDDKIALYNGNGLVVVRARIWGGDGNDMIYGGSDRDTIYGENGNDYINSGGNSDSVSGGNGDDNIYTGAGNDTASGDDGADRVLGGSGNDVLSGGNDGSHDHIDAGDGQNVIFGQAVYDIFFAGKPGENPNGMDEILLT